MTLTTRTIVLAAALWAGGPARPAASATLPGRVLGERPLPVKNCTGLASGAHLYWLADHLRDQILGLDPATGKVVRRFKSPGYRPGGLAFDGKQLWNVDVLAVRLYRLRPQDGLVTRSIPAPVALPRALAWDGRALWLSDDQGRTIHRVDPEDGTTISEIPFPSRSVDGLSWDGRYLWVADRLDDRLYALDTAHREVVATLPAPGPHASGLGFRDGRLLVADYQQDRLVALGLDGDEFLLPGKSQRLWVTFIHQVRNLGPDPVENLEVFLAVPPPLPVQKLLSGPSFEPAPRRLRRDRWGQQVASFTAERLAAGATHTVRMQVQVESRELRWLIWPERVGALKSIPAGIRRRYLVDEPKYDINNPVIREAVRQATQGESNPYWMVRGIYRHIHQRMHYERIGGWDVAPKVLERGSGSCSEYSYVMIAMCRAAGIPARYVGSLVVRRDRASWDDVFHRWVEVYLPGYGWVPVDPSRGDKPSEAERADAFGHLGPDFLITTRGGGASEYLGWNYNYNERHQCRGRCRVEVEPIAEWTPEKP